MEVYKFSDMALRIVERAEGKDLINKYDISLLIPEFLAREEKEGNHFHAHAEVEEALYKFAFFVEDPNQF